MHSRPVDGEPQPKPVQGQSPRLMPLHSPKAVGGENRDATPQRGASLFVLQALHSSTMSDTLVVNEIYLSLQGESTCAGLPCIFVRLTACNLRCSYCDTAYAFTEGRKMSVIDIRAEVHKLAQPFSQHPASRGPA